MRVKLYDNGYTKIYESGTSTSVNGDYSNDDEVVEFLANGGVVEPFETQAEIDARIIAEANAKEYSLLEELDKQSIRDIREYIASLPDSPQLLKDRESQAIAARAKIVK